MVLSSKMERTQNYALRLIFHKPPRMSSADLQAEALGWTPLKRRRMLAVLDPSVLEERSSKLPHQLKYELFQHQRSHKIFNRPNTNFY